MMKNESGRSMVEMLGVLAIIGVLSVGGIAGYTMAMNKYKANEIVSAASQCAIMARSSNGGNGGVAANTTCESLGAPAPTSGVSMTAQHTAGADVVEVSVTAPSKAICDAVATLIGTTKIKTACTNAGVIVLQLS